MPSVYCPLSMIGGGDRKACVKYNGNDCHSCPADSFDRLARNLYDLVDVVNVKDFYDSNTDISNALEDVSESIDNLFETKAVD